MGDTLFALGFLALLYGLLMAGWGGLELARARDSTLRRFGRKRLAEGGGATVVALLLFAIASLV